METEIHDLTTLPNIGKNLSTKLSQVGICKVTDLLNAGTEAAFIRIKTVDPSACINMLFAIEGAIRGIRWHDLPEGRKEELRILFKSLK